VKVMDFGIARALGEGQNVTQTAAVIGTAQYLSPEQARGEAVDARSDVYAAGCVLYELLTGEPPFTGDTPVAVAYQHVREDPKPPSSVNPQIPPALDAVILKALSKNPANRYQSAAELRADLVRVRNGQSPMAPSVMSEDERTAMLAASATVGPVRRVAARPGSPTGARLVGDRRQYSDHDYEHHDDRPRRRSRRIVLIVAALVLGILGSVSYLVLSSSSVAVPPALVGRTEAEARDKITEAGLEVGQVVRVVSTTDKSGKVTATEPAPGTLVEEHTAIDISVGNGPVRPLPNVITSDP
jgi:hypothetical protein